MSFGIAVLEFGWLLLITSMTVVCLPAIHAYWPDGGGWMWMALPSALSCTVSYYCTDLYDPRVVNEFKKFRAGADAGSPPTLSTRRLHHRS
jgi:hypothetical protein